MVSIVLNCKKIFLNIFIINYYGVILNFIFQDVYIFEISFVIIIVTKYIIYLLTD